MLRGGTMAVQQKIFRIEQTGLREPVPPVFPRGNGDQIQQTILAELKGLRELIERSMGGPNPASGAVPVNVARSSNGASANVDNAIARTKHELAHLHAGAFGNGERARVTRELRAVVDDTERATGQILAAAEDIDETTKTLLACLKNEHEQALAQDMQDQIIRIFEACNFQDLGGQRISKVLATFEFVEAQILHLMEIWGGSEACKQQVGGASGARPPDGRLAHGPKLSGDQGHASQDFIDKLFEGPDGAAASVRGAVARRGSSRRPAAPKSPPA